MNRFTVTTTLTVSTEVVAMNAADAEEMSQDSLVRIVSLEGDTSTDYGIASHNVDKICVASTTEEPRYGRVKICIP
jgi:hypothetical protein